MFFFINFALPMTQTRVKSPKATKQKQGQLSFNDANKRSNKAEKTKTLVAITVSTLFFSLRHPSVFFFSSLLG